MKRFTSYFFLQSFSKRLRYIRQCQGVKMNYDRYKIVRAKETRFYLFSRVLKRISIRTKQSQNLLRKQIIPIFT